MSNFADDLEESVKGAEIVGVVIGRFGWGAEGAPDEEAPGFGERTPIPLDKKGKLLEWVEARPLLDYTYSTGHGTPDCHAVSLYTETTVFFVSQYKGATGIASIPRYPINHNPEMPGA